MKSANDRYREFVEQSVRGLLSSRVQLVEAEIAINEDNQDIARITIVYDNSDGITVAEMDSVFDALWPGDGESVRPFPIIDFQADSDFEPVAAE